MEKTCAAEKNRTTDIMWVEKKQEKRKKGGNTQNKGALWCAKKNVTKKR